jgi:hypothetical protein
MFAMMVSFLTNSFIKIGIALMLMRTKPEWRVGLWLLIGSSVAVAILAIVFQLVQCRPIHAFWNIEMRLSGNYCLAPGPSIYPYLAWGSVFSETLATVQRLTVIGYYALTDFILALLP